MGRVHQGGFIFVPCAISWACFPGAGKSSSNISHLKEGKERKVKSLSRVQLFASPRTVAYQAPPSMGFSRQEYWSGLPFPSPWKSSDGSHKPILSYNENIDKLCNKIFYLNILDTGLPTFYLSILLFLINGNLLRFYEL